MRVREMCPTKSAFAVLITVLLLFCQLSLGGTVYTDFIETDYNDSNWVVVTSNLILRENLCDPDWYEKVFNPCDANDNKYWLLPVGEQTGHAFPLSQIKVDVIESLYVADGHGFQLYYNSDEPYDLNDLEPASAFMKGSMYVTVDYWRDSYPAPNGFEPNTFFVSGGPGELGNYSTIVRQWTALDDICHIENGSFEYDRQIDDITAQSPQNWDTQIDSAFYAYVKNYWVTEGNYNLTLSAVWGRTADANDSALLTQQVCLIGVNEIIFDLKLETLFDPWDPAVCVPVVMIDGNDVWGPNTAASDIRGEYFDESYKVEEKYKTGEHTLSLGLRVNTAGMLSDSYIAQWDNIEFTYLSCGGGGFLAEDLNEDCYVDVYDLGILAEQWLEEVAIDDANNLYDGDDYVPMDYINMRDFAVLAENWKSNPDMTELGNFVQVWLQIVPADSPYNLYIENMEEGYGFINLYDLAVLAEKWMMSSFP